MKICSVCQRCYEDSVIDCAENHGALGAARSGSRQINADYRLDLLLERDAAGEIYQATRDGFEQPFNVKTIAPNRIKSDAQREKMQAEARSVAAINHPNLARVYESGSTSGGEFYVVSEAVDGRTLRECLRNIGAFSESEAVMIAGRIAGAVEAAHRVGTVHRAVGPANIIFALDDRKPTVKLQNFDFGGVAEQAARDALSNAAPPIDALRYLAPEQCAGEPTDARTDVYSLAVVLYEMLCGRSPFGAPTAAAISERRVNEQPLERIGFDTRALLKHLLRQSLQNRPEARPASANVFARQLRHIEQLLGLPGATARDVSPAAPNSEAAIVSADSPPESNELSQSNKMPPAERRAPEAPGRENVAAVLPPSAALPIVGQIEENLKVDAEEKSEDKAEGKSIGKTAIDAALFAAPIRLQKKETDAESFAAEPILTGKKDLIGEKNLIEDLIEERNSAAKKEASDVSFRSEPIAVRKKFASEPIVVRKKPAHALESAPISAERKQPAAIAPEAIDSSADDEIVTREIPASALVFAEPRETAANVPVFVETRETTTSAAPIFADFHNEKRPPRALPKRRPLFAGVGLLALLAALTLGALLYRRQQQLVVSPPTVAAAPSVSDSPQLPETSSAINGETALSDAPKTEKSAPSATEKSLPAAAKRESQPRENAPTIDTAAKPNETRNEKQNESPKNQTARENSAETTSNNRSRIAAADGDAQTELNASLGEWVTATNARNVERQMTYYAPKVNAYYRSRNVSPDAVRAEKRRVFESADAVDIQTGKPEIAVSPDGKSATMRFRKKYAIRQGQQNRSGEVVQELQWVKSGGGWRIVSERDVKVINH